MKKESGVRELISEIYYDAAVFINNEYLPHWIKTRGVHPDDRNRFDGPGTEKFLRGARGSIITTEGDEIIFKYDECIERLIDHMPKDLLERFCQGIPTLEDYNAICQIAIFGKVRYPVESEVLHDAQTV